MSDRFRFISEFVNVLIMAYSSLPILFYNLGGEMLYVLDQRLMAQKIPPDRAGKVMADIVATMFNKESLKEMEKPQVVYSKQAMRTIFTKIVHSSIMKVNTDSMEKLFDLMLMAVKYQFIKCANPNDLLHLTLNHIDAILEFVHSNVHVTVKVKNVFKRIVESYGEMTQGEFMLIRQALLLFVQDSNNKVSIYLNQKKQNNEGKFVIETTGEVAAGSDVPGTIHLYKHGKQTIATFKCGCDFKPHTSPDSMSNEIEGNRCTSLGTNLYKDSNITDYSMTSGGNQPSTVLDSCQLAKAELSLLAQMIGSNTVVADDKEFRLDLFSSTDDFSAGHCSNRDVFLDDTVVNITATKCGAEQLTQIVDDLTINSTSSTNTRGEDLLSLMDL